MEIYIYIHTYTLLVFFFKNIFGYLYCIQESISNNSNEAIRDLSSKCIMEYIHWALKTDNSHQKSSVPLHIIINKIEQFCIHSDPNKQLGKLRI